MTDKQNSDMDARTEALEDLASTADQLWVGVVLLMMTVGTTGFGLIGFLEHPAPMWIIYPIAPTGLLLGVYAFNAIGDFLSWCLRVVGASRRRVQVQNQSNTSDGDMDSKQVNLSEQEESA